MGFEKGVFWKRICVDNEHGQKQKHLKMMTYYSTQSPDELLFWQ